MAANLTAPDEQQIAARLLEAATIAEWAEQVVSLDCPDVGACPQVEGFLGYDPSDEDDG
jgi:hypothetical protein